MSTHTAGPMEAARAAWVRIGRAKPNGDIDVFRKADAEMRLIVSAPDLLAALQAMYAAQYKPFDHADRRAAKEQASAAIAKATGAQS